MKRLLEVRDRSVAEKPKSARRKLEPSCSVVGVSGRTGDAGAPAGRVKTRGRCKWGSMSSFSRAPQQWATFARMWYLLDGKMQPPGKLAAIASKKLQGLHKPVYHQLSDCGDHVVIINTRHIAFSGNKWEQKVYSSHTGYPGGFRQVTAAQLHLKDPVAIVKLATYGMLPKNLHRRTMMQRLHLFPDEDIPEDILKNLVEELPQPRKVPKRLDEYTQEEIEAFPRVWAPPEDYRL